MVTLAVLLALSRLTVIQAAGPVTVAWDAVTGVSGYNVRYGTASGQETTVVDAGGVTQWTSPSLPAGTYYFTVTSYTPTAESLPSAEVNTLTGPFAPATNCVPPLGAQAVSIFITSQPKATTGAVGSKFHVDYQLGSPNSPVTSLVSQINGVNTDPASTGTDLTRFSGLWFTAPTTAGTYPVTITATNTAGCSTTASKDALGNPLTLTVK